jgi:CDP-diacylglycerol--serine O-phosphatidyltransferase
VKYFEGTPIPTTIVIVGLLAIAFMLERIDGDLWFGSARIASATLHPLALIFVASGSAMISTVRIPKP